MNNQTISYVPYQMVKFCLLDNTNQKKQSSLVNDIAQVDNFFRILIERRMDISFEHNTFVKRFSEIGPLGFRNQLALAFLSYSKDKNFFSFTAKSELQEVLDLEESLQEYLPSSDNTLFLLLFHLKNNEIIALNKGQTATLEGYDFSLIKNILKNYKSNSHRVDWLVVLIHSLIKVYDDKAESKINEYNGEFSKLVDSLSLEQRKSIVESHLDYGQAIDDSDYFLFNKV